MRWRPIGTVGAAMAAAAGLGIGGAALAAAKEESLASVTKIGATQYRGAADFTSLDSAQGGQPELPVRKVDS